MTRPTALGTVQAIALAAAVALAATAPARALNAKLCAEVERVATAAAVATIAAPDTFEPLAARCTSLSPVDGGTDGAAVEPVDVRGPNRSGRAMARLRIVRDGRPVGTATATVRGVVRGPALVATRPLSRGEAIPPDAVAITTVDLTRVASRPLRSADALVGLAPVRTLAASTVLHEGVVEPRAIVRRGDVVELVLVHDRITLKSKGIVRRDGAPGDAVPVDNAASGASLVGRVRPDGSVLVVQGAVRRLR